MSTNRIYDSCWRVECMSCPLSIPSKCGQLMKPHDCLISLEMDTEYNDDADRVCKANQQALARVGRAPYVMNRFGRL